MSNSELPIHASDNEFRERFCEMVTANVASPPLEMNFILFDSEPTNVLVKLDFVYWS